jgi:hypothetical protein
MRSISLLITDYLALRVLLNAMLKISIILSLISVINTLTRISRVSGASNGHCEALNYCEHVQTLLALIERVEYLTFTGRGEAPGRVSIVDEALNRIPQMNRAPGLCLPE